VWLQLQPTAGLPKHPMLSHLMDMKTEHSFHHSLMKQVSKCVDPISYDRIEKMRKEVKTHRSVADINDPEVHFILAVMSTN
jgi:hypothetical protein